MLTSKAALLKKLADLIIAAMPAIEKLTKALQMVKEDKWPRAEEFLRQIAANIDMITTAYGGEISLLKNVKELYDDGIKMVKQKKPEAQEKIQTLLEILSKVESHIRQLAIQRR